MSGQGFSIMHATIRTGDKLPDLLKIESKLCSPVIHQLKVSNLSIIIGSVHCSIAKDYR